MSDQSEHSQPTNEHIAQPVSAEHTLTPQRVYELTRLHQIRPLPKTTRVQVSAPLVENIHLDIDEATKASMQDIMTRIVLPFLEMGCVVDAFEKDDPARDPIYNELRDGVEQIEERTMMEGTTTPMRKFIQNYAINNQLRANVQGKVLVAVSSLYIKARRSNPSLAQEIKQVQDTLKLASTNYGEKTNEEKLQTVQTYQETILRFHERLFGVPTDPSKTVTFATTQVDIPVQHPSESEEESNT